MKPSAQWSSRVKVYIHALPETGSFKLSRFLPTKNNVRQKWWSEVTVDGKEWIWIVVVEFYLTLSKLTIYVIIFNLNTTCSSYRCCSKHGGIGEITL